MKKIRIWVAQAAIVWIMTASSAPAFAHDAQPCDALTLETVAAYVGRSDLRISRPSSTSGVAEEDLATPIVAAVCKRWPDDEKVVATAVAFHPPGAEPDGGWGSNQLIVALVDTTHNKVIRAYRGTIDEDAEMHLTKDSLWLDTARYQLAPDRRAFGVVVSSMAHGANCPDSWFYDELTLYAPDGVKLRPVFNTHLHDQTTLEGNSCSREFVSESAMLFISVGNGVSHGLADLVVTARAQTDGGDGEAAWSKPVRNPRVVQRVVQYNGKTYPFEQYPTFWQTHR